ncbi:MAG: class A beta-lactamase-related serine hydrolase [Bacteroidetes bacterium]|nr:MAG: class A beta-lactamase-related serine hydrolase [Bacteroidota bacterium]
MKKLSFLFVFSLLGLIQVSAQEDKSEKLSDFIERTLQSASIIPGVSVAVADANGTLYTSGFGFADVENKIPATANTDFYIASITKSFNGLLATILAEEGRIDLNAQITRYKPFSEFEDKELFQNITVMDLLSHQSGIDNKYLSFKLAYTGDYTKEEILNLVENDCSANEDGKAFDYSNFGYYLLDLLLMAELDESWKDLLQKKIFSPLGMANTTAYISKANPQNLALPYMTIFPEKVDQVYLKKNDQTMHAAGGLVTSANDIARFISFYASKGSIGDQPLYPSSLIRQTYAQQTEADHRIVQIFEAYGYGAGWRLGKYKGNEVAYHFGGYPGFFSHLSFLPEQQIGVAVFVNHQLGMPLADLIAEYAYDLYLGNEEHLQVLDKTAADKLSKMLERYQKGFKANEEKMSKRTWQLTLPKQAYTGTYYHEKIGSIMISLENETFKVKSSRLQAEATPFTKEDCMRIELIPGSGKIIQFKSEGGKIESLKFRGEIFKKL